MVVFIRKVCPFKVDGIPLFYMNVIQDIAH